MNINLVSFFRIVVLLLVISSSQLVKAQFVHPGGLHTKADLDRMKEKVAANASPWIEGWNVLCGDYRAQKTYVANPSTTVGGSGGTRQQAAQDGVAAYDNALRWYITGDVAYADCAVRILNAWSYKVNAVVTGELFQLPIMTLVQAAEILRTYDGWSATDFNQFKSMCLNYFYPACKSFLGDCRSWSSWDAPANLDIMLIGILCDDQAKFDEAVNYYKTGVGGGSINHIFCQPNGQVAEMGRDQPHAEIGPCSAAELAQCAWNQGVDLFSYSDNLLLKGFEYFANQNLNHAYQWTPYNNCNNVNFYTSSTIGINSLSWCPAWEIVYNHYVERQGLTAPNTRAFINLRGFITPTWHFSYVGYYGLTYTLSDTTTLFKLKPIPATPSNLKAIVGVSNVVLKWTEPSIDAANGYIIQRSTSLNGTYTTVGTLSLNVSTEYVDKTVSNGITYYYKVAAKNQSGTSDYSTVISATPVVPVALPAGWTMQDVGTVATVGTASYSTVNDNTFVIKSSGNDLWGGDSHGYASTQVTGDFSITARLFNATISTNKDRVGLMMRESLAYDSKRMSIGLNDLGFRTTAFIARTTTAGSNIWTQGNAYTCVPSWFKLQRSGNTFAGYQSADGIKWFKVGTSTVTMNNTCNVGMFICAGTSTAGVITSVTFDNVKVASFVSAPSGLNATPVNSSRIALSWNAAPNATSYSITRSTSSTSGFMTIATPSTTSFEDSGLNANTTYYYIIKSATADGLSADSVKINAQTLDYSYSLAPTVSISKENTTLTLTWNSVDEATAYYIKRSTSLNGVYTTIATSTTTSYTDNSIVSTATYYYKVAGYNPVTEGVESEPVSIAVVKVLDSKDEKICEMYPNPSNNILYLTTESDKVSIFTYDVNGKLLINEVVKDKKVNVNSLKAGIYFLKIETKEGIVIKKFVKE